MTITTRDQLINALGNNASRVVLDKANLANQTAGRMCSFWRATGQPAQGAIPAAAAICTNATLGGVQFLRDGDAFAGGGVAAPDDFDDISEGADASDLV